MPGKEKTEEIKPETTKKDKDEELKAKLIEEAKALGIPVPRITTGGVKEKNKAEAEAHKKKQFIHLLQHMIANVKAKANLKPIDKRRELLKSRFRAVKGRNRAFTYSDANLKAWLEELKMIEENPKSWNKITVKGTKPYIPGNKRKRTAMDILDSMDLE